MCLHLVRPWKVCPDWLVCCFLLQLCFCCHPLHPPLALQWSWWAYWLLKCLGESTKNAATREHNEECTHGWTFNPTKKEKTNSTGSPLEDTGEVRNPDWPQHSSHSNSSVFFPLCSVIPCPPDSGVRVLPPAREADQSPGVSSLTLPVPFPPFSPPLLYSPMLLPHVTLYLPYEQSAPPITLSPLTLTFALPKKTKFLWKKLKSFGSSCLNNSGRPLSSEDY